MRHFLRVVPAVVFVCLLGAALAWASTTGSISGVVTDPNGGVIVGAKVTAIETQTGVRSEITTDSQGFYNFSALPVGKYDVEVLSSGFKAYRQSGLVIDVNSALRVDVKLQVGEVSEKVTVMSESVHVDTESTQNGQVIEGSKILNAPLNGRAYTTLLSLQPGVVPSAYSNQAPDTSNRAPSGDLNSGNVSVNGQRESANGFMVNGANVMEGRNNGAGIIPNLDSIEEFRIITNNFDAEYGNYSGSQVNVATRAGTNAFHGSAFEFLRNTVFDARNFFDAPGTIGDFKQNQFGGTGGGPIKRDKLFFFGDYQGTRQIRGNTVTTNVPSTSVFPDASGNANALPLFLAQSAANPLNDDPTKPLPASPAVGGGNWPALLSARLGYAVTAGEDYWDPATVLDPVHFPNQPVCTTNNVNLPNHCVFPNGIIPAGAISKISTNLLPSLNFLSSPAGFGLFTSSLPSHLKDDKGAIRIDDNTRFGTLSGYYFLDDFTQSNPTPANGIGANVPGFGDSTIGRAQLFKFGDTKTFGPTSVNEFHFSVLRLATHINQPGGGLGKGKLSSLGFLPPSGSGASFNGGIAPVIPAVEGVPFITLSKIGTTIGIPVITTGQFNNTFQIQDNFTKVLGTHTMKFGAAFHWDQINERNFFAENGSFSFDGTETGADFADFLIGAVGLGSNQAFIQASQQLLDSRTKYFGTFFQDSWRVKSSLTFNYGLRWEFGEPWYDIQNKIDTIVPGQQSVVFTKAPKGLLFPGDKGVPPSLSPTQYNAFSPRLGLAYSPATSSGLLSKLTGGPGKTSIRAGFGIFYSTFEDLSQFQEVGDIPFGLFWSPTGQKLFEAPFNDRQTGPLPAPVFPFSLPVGATAQHPNSTFDFTPFEPLTGNAEVAFHSKNRLPYAEHFDLNVQRQLGASTLVSFGYVGTVGHKLVTFINSNPGIPGLCLFLSDPNNLQARSNVCGPGSEDGGPFVLKSGVTAPGFPGITSFASTRLIAGLNSPSDTLVPFGSNAYEKTIANSAYHSLQATLRHTSSHGDFLVGYTLSKCLDNSSGLEDPTNPYNPKVSRGLCLFDVKHNFVASYTVGLPIDKLLHANGGWSRRVAAGWQLTGVSTFATGLPVQLSEGNDVSLAGSIGTDIPNFTPGKVLNDTNPRHESVDQNGNVINPYFSTTLFSKENPGQIGNANRRFFHGPGLNNWDMALLKDTKITESKELELRFEAFNIFNHAQFQNPNGSIDSSNFGRIIAANDPRILQVAAKFRF
jgi:hypothetical protein